MSLDHFLQQIFSNPGAFAQDFDDSFLLLTNIPLSPETAEFYKLKIVNNFTPSQLFAPTFFELTQDNLKFFHHCFRIERPNILLLLESYFEAITTTKKSLTNLPWKLQARTFFDDDFNNLKTKNEKACC